MLPRGVEFYKSVLICFHQPGMADSGLVASCLTTLHPVASGAPEI
jgi:hypothetical protein